MALHGMSCTYVRMYVCTYMHLYCITEDVIAVCNLICRGDGEAPHEAWWTATGEAGAHNSGAAVCLSVSAWVSSVSISFVSFDITGCCKFYGFGLQNSPVSGSQDIFEASAFIQTLTQVISDFAASSASSPSASAPSAPSALPVPWLGDPKWYGIRDLNPKLHQSESTWRLE